MRCSWSHLLYAETEVEEAVGGVRLSIRPFHLRDETDEAFAQLSLRTLENILVECDSRSYRRSQENVGEQMCEEIRT